MDAPDTTLVIVYTWMPQIRHNVTMDAPDNTEVTLDAPDNTEVTLDAPDTT